MAIDNPLQPRGGLLDMMGQGDSGFAGWLNPRRNSIINFGAGLIGADSARDAMRGAAQGAAQGRQQDTAYAMLQQEQAEKQRALQEEIDQRNQTTEWLRANYPQFSNLPPAQGFQAAMSEMSRASSAAGRETFFGTPIWGVGPDGQPAFGQLNNQGEFQLTEMPDGFQVGKDPIRMDAGTHHVLLDPVTRQQIGIIPKENYQESYDSTMGSEDAKRRAEAIAGAPQAIATAQRTLQSIDGLLDDPNLGKVVGGVGGMLPNHAFNPWAGTISRIEQLQGQAFLQAFETLKGGGQITEVEGLKAENAMARLQRSQNEAEYRAALQELRDIVAAGLARAQQQANGIFPGTPAGPAATGGMPTGTTSSGITWSIE